MKKLLAVLALVAAAGAWAGGSTVSTRTYTTSAAGPTNATDGIPLTVNGNQVSQVHVTVATPFDGGQGMLVLATQTRAWKYSIQYQTALFDGGYAFSWSRWPSMDLAINVDGGSGTGVTLGEGMTMSATVPKAGNADRLYYTWEWLSVLDAGTMLQANVIIEGVY